MLPARQQTQRGRRRNRPNARPPPLTAYNAAGALLPLRRRLQLRLVLLADDLNVRLELLNGLQLHHLLPAGSKEERRDTQVNATGVREGGT